MYRAFKLQNFPLTRLKPTAVLKNSPKRMNFIKSVGKNLASGFTDKYLEKPDYKVVTDGEGFEERCYPESLWVSTSVESMVRKEAVNKGFWRLFNYIQGKNKEEKKIDMTAPVASKIEPGPGPNCESRFTVSFYVGKAHWDQPPEPSDPEVFLEKWPQMNIYTRAFGGSPDDEQWLEEARSLGQKLVDSKVDIEQSFYYTAGYDAPFKLFNRRNEVWFLKKDSSGVKTGDEQKAKD